MKLKLASYIIVACIGAAIYHTVVGPKVVTETKTVEVVKVVQDVKKETIKRPDGTVIIKEETKTIKDSNKRTAIKEKQIRNDYAVSIKRDLLNQSEWTGEVGRRIIGDLYLGVYYRTDNTAGVSLTFTF